MNDLQISHTIFNPNGFWSKPIQNVDLSWIKSQGPTYLFDQNGYDLCPLEQLYAKENDVPLVVHRSEKHLTLQQPWFSQEEKLSGCVLNHSMIFERKGYTGTALQQLDEWIKLNPLIQKVKHIEPKWGIDFSLDYVDEKECFEVLHFEYDGFSVQEVLDVKQMFENKINKLDFDKVVKDLIDKKEEWINLEFFEQSEWKCKYFGIPNERFKMVVWQQ
jgi:hypothetical protein